MNRFARKSIKTK